ncbi:ParB/RepB/Spo0J family partition protein [Sphingomonas sp. RT2P30]|uniref:ParB/RepB/Spo0J family partition protein n=1 Tax=Parasphingomonas halimpatiens TaxID=3096162 RepID=UPI002FCCA0D1
MASKSPSAPKLVLSSSRDIPFNKLLLSQSNVRRIKAGVSIEELAEDIARRTLLQSITVRPVLDADGAETGMFEIPAGGRRFRALELLVKQKHLARTAPVPCVVRHGGIAEEDSLAENVHRAPLHPLDQFRAFLAMREKGQSEEEIAAAFFAPVSVVKQRLRLASVSPRLLEVYAEDGMTLDQLMAFTVNSDHARQEQAFEQIANSHYKEPHVIRRMLTEGAVRASDKRAQLIGADAYIAAGGTILRDLFQGDDGGWFQDAALLDLLVTERLRDEALALKAEGWLWIDAAPDFPFGHTYGLRQLRGEQPTLTDEQQAAWDALTAENDRLEQQYADADELPEEVDHRLGEIETAIGAIADRPILFDAADVVRAGAFVSIDGSGNLRIERGYVRAEDEEPVEPAGGAANDNILPADVDRDGGDQQQDDGRPVPPPSEPEEDDGIKPLPDSLLSELTAHRTLALRFELGEVPDIAFVAGLHALCLRAFYRFAQDSCLELDLKHSMFAAQPPGLADSDLAQAFDARHQAWSAALPEQPVDLWDVLLAFGEEEQRALFAHCVSLSLNAVHEAYNRRPRAIAHADRLAEDIDLDMVAAGWEPMVGNYLGRVTKARILLAVREGKGEQAAEAIAHLKKIPMAEKAQELLAGSGWVPEPLRMRGHSLSRAEGAADDASSATAEVGNEELAMNGGERHGDADPEPADNDNADDGEPIAAE